MVSTAPPLFARPERALPVRAPDVLEVMVMVTRFDPFRDLDRLAERLITQAGEAQQAMRALPVDLFRSGDHYALLCDLPASTQALSRSASTAGC